MKRPQWYREKIAQLAPLLAAGDAAHARGQLAAEIREHPEYVADLIYADVLRSLPVQTAAADPRQAELFPDLPPLLHVRVGVAGNWLGFTRRDWETARNMLLARTANQAHGAAAAARRERDAFMGAYDAVVPLLIRPEMTTADVAARLRKAG